MRRVSGCFLLGDSARAHAGRPSCFCFCFSCAETVTGTAGPNGQEDWFNCGVDNGGWNPPHVTVSDIVTVELADAVQDPNSPFKACSAYIDTFYKYASQHGRESASSVVFHPARLRCLASPGYPRGFDRHAGELLQPCHRRWWR